MTGLFKKAEMEREEQSVGYGRARMKSYIHVRSIVIGDEQRLREYYR
jgi:hypothetical protein